MHLLLSISSMGLANQEWNSIWSYHYHWKGIFVYHCTILQTLVVRFNWWEGSYICVWACTCKCFEQLAASYGRSIFGWIYIYLSCCRYVGTLICYCDVFFILVTWLYLFCKLFYGLASVNCQEKDVSRSLFINYIISSKRQHFCLYETIILALYVLMFALWPGVVYCFFMWSSENLLHQTRVDHQLPMKTDISLSFKIIFSYM